MSELIVYNSLLHSLPRYRNCANAVFAVLLFVCVYLNSNTALQKPASVFAVLMVVGEKGSMHASEQAAT